MSSAVATPLSGSSATLLSAADVARLAGVQRPVVSMWRRRPVRGQGFPTPVTRADGVELFAADEVVAYLSETGRGLNPEAADDVAAHVALAAVTPLPEAVAVAGLSALLCLATMTGAPLGELPADDVLALAGAEDPDDAVLVREIRALGDELPQLAAHAEALADAGFSASAAFERLLRRHVGSCLPGHAATARRSGLDALVGGLATALLTRVAGATPLLVDDSDGDGGLLLAARSAWGEHDLDLRCSAADSATARWTRRRLLTHGVPAVDPPTEGPCVHVVHLPCAGDPDAGDATVLKQVGALARRLRPADLAVVVGPASALTDRAASPDVEVARDAVLRAGFVRTSVRLPHGLLVRAPRRATALWVLSPAPGLPATERWLAVGELGAADLDPVGVDDLVSDVLAALDCAGHPASALARGGGIAQLPARQLRYLRRRGLIDVLTSQAGLRVLLAPGRPTSTAGEVSALLEACGAGVRVEGVQQPVGPGTATLGRLVADRQVRLIKGRRLDGVPVQVGTQGGVTVLGPAEVRGESPVGERRVDLLEFTRRFPAGWLTERGDVVFVVSPRPAAFVDVEGGAVAQAPARVLRATREGEATLLPRLLAEAVAEAARAGGVARHDYRRWVVPLVPAVQREPLRQALAVLDAERRALRERLARLDAAEAALTAGVTSGAVVVVPGGAPP